MVRFSRTFPRYLAPNWLRMTYIWHFDKVFAWKNNVMKVTKSLTISSMHECTRQRDERPNGKEADVTPLARRAGLPWSYDYYCRRHDVIVCLRWWSRLQAGRGVLQTPTNDDDRCRRPLLVYPPPLYTMCRRASNNCRTTNTYGALPWRRAVKTAPIHWRLFAVTAIRTFSTQISYSATRHFDSLKRN